MTADIVGAARSIQKKVDLRSLMEAGMEITPSEYDFVYGYPALAMLQPTSDPSRILHGSAEGELAIYVHFPFCNYACTFCYFAKQIGSRDEVVDCYLKALEGEIHGLGEHLRQRVVTSVYFGGGTPTYLSARRLLSVVDLIRARFTIAAECEWTVEASPETLDPEKARVLVGAGVNRISVGIQSFNDQRLRSVGRKHSATEARGVIRTILESGVRRHNIDLIYGYPGQEVPEILREVAAIRESGVQSVTWYQLWQHMATPLRRRAGSCGGLTAKDMLALKTVIEAGMTLSGFLRDKVDWFVQDAAYSQRQQEHKWAGGDFVGLGMSAYGFMGGFYYRNHTSMREYLAAVGRNGSGVGHGLDLSVDQRVRRRLMLGIKRSSGVPLVVVDGASEAVRCELEERIKKLASVGMIARQDSRLFLTSLGQMYGDDVVNALGLSADDRAIRARSRQYCASSTELGQTGLRVKRHFPKQRRTDQLLLSRRQPSIVATPALQRLPLQPLPRA